MKWEASAERWGWIDGWTDRLLIVEVCSYIRAAWGHSNRSLSLIYPPAKPSVHRHLSESINAIWLPASQQLCDRKSMCIMWQILYVHVCMRAPYMSIHRSAHFFFFLPLLRLFTSILSWFVTNCSLNCVLVALFFAICVNPSGFYAAMFAAFTDL